MGICPANSVQTYLPLFDKQKKRVVLDYGSGNLRNSLYLHTRGFEVIAVDLPGKTQCSSVPGITLVSPDELKTTNLYIDVTLCTFVLNLIDVTKRVSVFETIAKNTMRGGYLLIETKDLTLREMDSLALLQGFARIHNDNGRFTQIVLYQLIFKKQKISRG